MSIKKYDRSEVGKDNVFVENENQGSTEILDISPDQQLEKLDSELARLDNDNLLLIEALFEKYTGLIKTLDKKDPMKAKLIERMNGLRTMKKKISEKNLEDFSNDNESKLVLNEKIIKLRVLPEKDSKAFEDVSFEFEQIKKRANDEGNTYFNGFCEKIADRFNGMQKDILKAKNSACLVTQFRGMVFELSRIVDVLRQESEEIDFSKIGYDLKVKYLGYKKNESDFSQSPLERKVNKVKKDGNTVEEGVPIDFDVPIIRNGKPYIYETKSYPKESYGTTAPVRNQILKYQAAIDQGLVEGATVELSGKMDMDFLVWFMGSRLEDSGSAPGVEMVYTQALPSGKEYRFVLKRALRRDNNNKIIDHGLNFFNEEKYDEEDQRVISGIERSIVEHPMAENSIISILTKTQLNNEACRSSFGEMFPEPVENMEDLKRSLAKLFDYDPQNTESAGRVIRSVLNDRTYEFEEAHIIEDLARLVGLESSDNPQKILEALWQLCFEKPQHISSYEMFEKYDKLHNEAVFERFRRQKVIINSENTKSAVSLYATREYVEHEIRSFIQYLKKNPQVAAIKHHYVLPDEKIEMAIDKAMGTINQIAGYERARENDSQEDEARKKRKDMGYDGRPEGVALDIEHIIMDVIYGINKNGVAADRIEDVFKSFATRKKGETQEEAVLRLSKAKDLFFENTGADDRLIFRFKGLDKLEKALKEKESQIKDVYELLGKKGQKELQKISQEALIARDYDWIERFSDIGDFAEKIKNEDRKYQEIYIFDPLNNRMQKQEDTNDEEIGRSRLNIARENIRRARAYIKETGREDSHKKVIAVKEKELARLEAEKNKDIKTIQSTSKKEAMEVGEKIALLRKQLQNLQQSANIGKGSTDLSERISSAQIEIDNLEKAKAAAFLEVQKVSEKYQSKLNEVYIQMEQVYREVLPNDVWEKNMQKIVHEKEENQMKLIYVVNADGDILVQEEVLRGDVMGRAAHSELAQGRNIYGAGEFLFQKIDNEWVLTEINNGSGHYRPDANSTLVYVNNILKEKGIDTSQAHVIDAILRGRRLKNTSLF